MGPGSHRAKIKVRAGLWPSGGPQGAPCPCLSQLPEAPPCPGSQPLPSSSKQQWPDESFAHGIILTLMSSASLLHS